MADRRFELVCEIEPPTRPDLTRVRHQIGVLSLVADSFLIPDNHIGRATVSSVAVAREVQAMGARGIACLNSRDRNLLGFRRDLLTAAAYGVDRFLFVEHASHCSCCWSWRVKESSLAVSGLDTEPFAASLGEVDGGEFAALDLVQHGLAGDAEAGGGLAEG